MTGYSFSDQKEQIFAMENFEIRNLQDEIRVDELCQRLLHRFRQDLVENEKLQAAQAGALAHGADYFLREFVIPDRRENIFALRPGRVRQFAGNWYIVRNLEPNMRELANILKGIEAFYDWCFRVGKVSVELVETVRQECSQLDYYRQRIEDFWAIEGDGYLAWERECTLKE
jgi:hypothetical protein